MKRILLVIAIVMVGFLPKANAQYLDFTNVGHIGDSFTLTNYTFTYNLAADGHTLHCHWTFSGLTAGTIIQPALYVQVNNVFIVGFNDDEHSFTATGYTQCFDYDVDLGASGFTFNIAAGYDNLSLTDPYYYHGAGGGDEDVLFVL